MLLEFSVNGEADFECVAASEEAIVGMTLLFCFVVLMSLLLLNMLIAMSDWPQQFEPRTHLVCRSPDPVFALCSASGQDLRRRTRGAGVQLPLPLRDARAAGLRPPHLLHPLRPMHPLCPMHHLHHLHHLHLPRPPHHLQAEDAEPLPPPLNLLSVPYWICRSVQMLCCDGRGESHTPRHRLPTMHVSGAMMARLDVEDHRQDHRDSSASSHENLRRSDGAGGDKMLHWLQAYREENSAEATIQEVLSYTLFHEDEVVEEGRWRTRFAQKLSRTRMDLELQFGNVLETLDTVISEQQMLGRQLHHLLAATAEGAAPCELSTEGSSQRQQRQQHWCSRAPSESASAASGSAAPGSRAVSRKASASSRCEAHAHAPQLVAEAGKGGPRRMSREASQRGRQRCSSAPLRESSLDEARPALSKKASSLSSIDEVALARASCVGEGHGALARASCVRAMARASSNVGDSAAARIEGGGQGVAAAAAEAEARPATTRWPLGPEADESDQDEIERWDADGWDEEEDEDEDKDGDEDEDEDEDKDEAVSGSIRSPLFAGHAPLPWGRSRQSSAVTRQQLAATVMLSAPSGQNELLLASMRDSRAASRRASVISVSRSQSLRLQIPRSQSLRSCSTRASVAAVVTPIVGGGQSPGTVAAAASVIQAHWKATVMGRRSAAWRRRARGFSRACCYSAVL